VTFKLVLFEKTSTLGIIFLVLYISFDVVIFNFAAYSQALGDYTRVIDFSSLPSEVREGKVGPYWYHEDTNSFFDDVDHYKMTKAMCRLSCSECDKMEDQQNDGPRRRERFRNIGQLKGHLFHRHKLHMCSLCLEGRKVKYLSFVFHVFL
jgi:hypothetical protein